MRSIRLLLFILVCQSLHAQKLLTRFELSAGTETFTYEEGIQYCQRLDSISPYIKLLTGSMTDAGKPLHMLVFDADARFDRQGKNIILVNNAIHPGEPDGVEASLMLIRDIALNVKLRNEYRNSILLVIPFYNIGGTLNRSCCSRANQNGPLEYGFRANSKNLDLNRDFIKADALETIAFYRFFHEWRPHIFVDTHVSDGADYQYTMTLIHTQEEKYDQEMASFLHSRFIPDLYEKMKNKGQEMSPYVMHNHQVPDSGIDAFSESPRFSNEFAALFGCIALVSETHMLKPYNQRVMATYQLLQSVMELSTAHDLTRKESGSRPMNSPVNESLHWELINKSDSLLYTYSNDSLLFRGYTARMESSRVTGLDRLKYDRNKPFHKKIPYRSHLKTKLSIKSPKAYLLPQAWKEIISKLAENAVSVQYVQRDTILWVNSYIISSYETVKSPYEGHYLHFNTKADTQSIKIIARAGDALIIPDRRNLRFVMTVLEPESPDSYFNWNLFDPVLQQKEWFSDYVFEDIAAELLQKNEKLRIDFEKKKKDEPAFAKDAFSQLLYIYRNSPYYEKNHNRYPVYRLEY